MAHRRALRILTRSVACGLVAAAAAACGSTPTADDDGGGDVPLPPRADLVTPEGPSGDATAGEGAEYVPGAPAAPVPETPVAAVPEGAPRWFPPVGTVIRLAGIAPRDDRPLVETRTVRAGGDEDHLEVDVEVAGEGDGEDDVARETYLVTITDEELRVALAPDPLRRIPPPAREVPREPVVGQTWSTPAGVCRVEAVLQDVRTFDGTRTGCVRIRVTSPTGRATYRWFDPELGEIRREILDRDERIVAAWALCGEGWPGVERCREILLTR